MISNLKVALLLVSRSVTRGSKGTLLLTILIIALAFVNMTVMAGLVDGVVATIDRQVIDNHVGNIVAEPLAGEQHIRSVAALEVLIESTPGIVATSPRYILGATLVFDPREDDETERQMSWPIRSIDPAKEQRVTHLHEWMVAGEYLEPLDHDQIMLGRELSGGYGASIEMQSLQGADVGDEISVFYANGVERIYTVKGIFATRFPLVDIGAFVTQREMEGVLGLHDRASEILIRTEEPGREAQFIRSLEQRGADTVVLRPWTDYLSFFRGFTDSLIRIVGIISSIGLLVAGITIFIVIYINAFTRKRQIGILKAIGMSEGIITTSYVLQALFFGIVGVGLGASFMYFAVGPYFRSNPLDFPIGDVSLVVTGRDLLVNGAGLVVMSIIGGFLPSYRVVKADIIEAIWG